MSGWDDAGELFAEGIDWAVDKHYDWVHDGVARNAHRTGDRFRKIRKQPTRYGPKGDRLPAEGEEQQPILPVKESPQQNKYAPSQANSTTSRGPKDQYGQPANPYAYQESDRARDLAAQGAIGTDYSSPPASARSVKPPSDFSRSRGIDRDMGDSGYGPADYGRNPHGSRGYDDGYEGGDADDYRQAYKPERPSGPYSPPPYDPSRYVPHGAAGAAAVATQPRGEQQYLPPPRAYDDGYDDGYDSYDSDRERRRNDRKSNRGSRSRSQGRRSERDRGSEDAEGERGDGKHAAKHKMAATIGGALVGALAGYEISNRKGKPETFHTIAGAIVGAVGAREADKWIEGRREEKKEQGRRERGERAEEDDKRSRYNDRYEF